jgi:hypothetical protein
MRSTLIYRFIRSSVECALQLLCVCMHEVTWVYKTNFHNIWYFRNMQKLCSHISFNLDWTILMTTYIYILQTVFLYLSQVLQRSCIFLARIYIQYGFNCKITCNTCTSSVVSWCDQSYHILYKSKCVGCFVTVLQISKKKRPWLSVDCVEITFNLFC